MGRPRVSSWCLLLGTSSGWDCGMRNITNYQGNSGTEYNEAAVRAKCCSGRAINSAWGWAEWHFSRALEARVRIFQRRRKWFQTENTTWAPVRRLEHSQCIYRETVYAGVASLGALGKRESRSSKGSLGIVKVIHRRYHHPVLEKFLCIDLALKH